MKNTKQHDQAPRKLTSTCAENNVRQSKTERMNDKQLGYRFCSLFNAVMNLK
ncbi:hypothetical protein Q4575_17865 [Psychrosphaera sp. 1_MG-2023]|uniref:hypothetical protein n=1 Tax=Psychrosphaera sp. 1_MG-2023 TaxID=3062643 RepID=UPI0026E2A435|nr:hypothetical protein [Psychrosphaera sp. 1_MG-2023]MDO6721281.1 hypothetical protein [Psychrosphaera sp. 1_MG-2023]